MTLSKMYHVTLDYRCGTLRININETSTLDQYLGIG